MGASLYSNASMLLCARAPLPHCSCFSSPVATPSPPAPSLPCCRAPAQGRSAIPRAIRLGSSNDLGVGQLRQRPTVWGVQVPESSRGIVEVHPIGTLGCNRTEAVHPYITTHPETRDRKRGSQG